MQTRKILAAAAASLACVVATCQVSKAGLLPTDPEAMPAFQGTRHFTATTSILGTNFWISGDVDYAVYDKGDFDDSVALGNPTDPSGGNHYVYVYQFENINSIVDQPGSPEIRRQLQELSIGLNPIVGATAFNASTLDSVVPNPTSVLTSSSSVIWTYSSIAVGATSDYLYFTSPLPPALYNATLRGASIVAQHGPVVGDQGLPSPVPEPTMGLIAGAIAGFLAIRRRR